MNTNDWGQSELYLNAHDPCNAHPALNGQSHESWHVTVSILSALRDAWDLFCDHPRIDSIWKNSQKMLIAS